MSRFYGSVCTSSGHVEEVLLFNKFFSDCWYMP